MTTNAKDLNYESGVYEVILYLGDFLVEDSLEWVLGDVSLTVFSGKPKSVNPLYAVSFGPKPEIQVRILFYIPRIYKIYDLHIFIQCSTKLLWPMFVS